MGTSKKKLSLKKEEIMTLEGQKEIKGGTLGWWTQGCTDGCGPAKTALFCTNADCTADCGTAACDTDIMCTF